MFTLPDVAAVASVPIDVLPGIVVQLAALQGAVGARLAHGPREDDRPERLLTVKEAAPILGMSDDWLYRHADRLPFTRRPGPHTLRFSERGLMRYLADRGA